MKAERGNAARREARWWVWLGGDGGGTGCRESVGWSARRVGAGAIGWLPPPLAVVTFSTCHAFTRVLAGDHRVPVHLHYSKTCVECT